MTTTTAADDDDEEVDENEGSNQNPRKDDNEDDTDRGMHVLTFNAEKEQLAKANLSFHETRRCWIIEVQRPYDEKVTVGEGMLVWFDSYSTIGSAGEAADESCASVRFMEYIRMNTSHNSISMRSRSRRGRLICV